MYQIYANTVAILKQIRCQVLIRDSHETDPSTKEILFVYQNCNYRFTCNNGGRYSKRLGMGG